MELVCRNHPEVSEDLRYCVRCGGRFCRNCLVEIHGSPYCAGCKGEAILDVRSGVERTTYGPLRLATVWQRFAALILDTLLLLIPAVGIGFAFGLIEGADSSGANVIGTLISLTYEALMLQHNEGQTVGKKALKIRVVRPDGSALSAGQAWGRTLVKTICCFSYIPAFFTEDKTGLHDMAATTRVVEA